jgi:hypothetical protein
MVSLPDEFDGTSLVPGSHPIKSLLIGGRGAWIPFRSHSLSAYLGPKVHLLAVDCRAKRRLDRIVSSQTYSILFDEIRKLKGRGIEHLVILLGVPIGAFKFLSSKTRRSDPSLSPGGSTTVRVY